jgi:hypothetical protein
MSLTIIFLAFVSLCGAAESAVPVSGLRAAARDGQVFLTWQETDTPRGTTFNVYVSDKLIGDVRQATRAGHHIEQHSARDWWEDPASFTKGKAPGKPVGFRIQNSGNRLDPRGGLFVYTVPRGKSGRFYFAVTSCNAADQEDARLVPGANTLSNGVTAAAGPCQPIWQAEGQQPAAGAGQGKSLWLNLHAKGGVVANMEYLAFGDETLGWRAGLPFKFSVSVRDDEVIVRPTDRVWINRPHDEAGDGGTPAIWTFWYGYNSNIYDRKRMAEGVPTNYTEQRLLWILDWVRGRYQPDANRWYCSGSSMGGCGTISFGLRHPELFAALHAHVPIVSYTYLSAKGSAHRLEPSCWVGPIPADLKTNEGVPLLERMNATKRVTEADVDLPPVFVVHGRKDGSIPWENNPPFYRAMSDTKQSVTVFWDNGDHSTCGKDAPPDVKAWLQRFRQFRRDESYPVFSGATLNRNPGDGRPDNGDIIGWLNRGMNWRDIEDTPDHYAITLTAEYPGVAYPVQTDVTLRRVQNFKVAAGDSLRVSIGDAPPQAIKADAAGRITIGKVSIPSAQGVRIVLRRSQSAARPHAQSILSERTKARNSSARAAMVLLGP